MNNEVLNSILKEYSKRKLEAESNFEKRKKDLYNSIPRLLEIENKLNSCAITTAKNILNNNPSSLENLHKKIAVLKAEKSDILRQHGIDENFLKPNYSCPLCKDTGYITYDDRQTEMCKCLKQKLLNVSYDNSNLSNLEKENFSTFNDQLFSDEVDLSKYRLNISPKKNINNIKNSCMKFIENFDDPNSKNLLFTGNTGLRKNIYV